MSSGVYFAVLIVIALLAFAVVAEVVVIVVVIAVVVALVVEVVIVVAVVTAVVVIVVVIVVVVAVVVVVVAVLLKQEQGDLYKENLLFLVCFCWRRRFVKFFFNTLFLASIRHQNRWLGFLILFGAGGCNFCCLIFVV